MSTYPLSTGEAVQAVLEGRECESEDGRKMRLSAVAPAGAFVVISCEHSVSVIFTTHAKLRWRLVPTLVKRDDALRALAAGKTIKRGGGCFSANPGTVRFDDTERPFISAQDFADMFLDDSACWEILP